jgi:hypothetical protein
VDIAQSACIALTGLNLNPIRDPGFESPLARALSPWAVLHRAFSARNYFHIRRFQDVMDAKSIWH